MKQSKTLFIALCFTLISGFSFQAIAAEKAASDTTQTDKTRSFLLVFGSPADKAKIERYKKAAGPIMKKYGVILPPQQFKVSSVIKGNSQPKFLNYVEFPEQQNILDALNDPAYLKVINDRDEGFKDLNIFIVNQ